MSNRKLLVYCGVVFLVAVVLRLGLSLKLGLAQPMESDSYYYIQLAASLAHGDGYVVHDSFWPNAPSMQRLPGWPFAVSLVFRVCPFLSPDMAMRLLCVMVDGLNAGLIAVLAWRLFAQISVAVGAGLAYAIHPSALFLVYNGESEPLFVLLCLAGFLCVLGGGRRSYWAALLFGLACLVRVNYVLWIGAAGAFALLAWWVGRDKKSFPPLRWIVLMGALFLIPPASWAARNYQVCGHFPMLSTLRGQTLYGGNNDVVADSMEMWGYWIFPDSIPGEKKASDLARSLSEYDLDVYYYGRGLAYVKTHWFSMPRLLLGKLVRAYVPVPWKPNWKSYGVGAYRMALYGMALAGLCIAWKRIPWVFRVWFAAMVAVNVFTVLVFWGCFRFAFALEPFLLPFAAFSTMGLLSWRREREGRR